MEYKLPEKLINNPMKMGSFLRSDAYHKVIRFIQKVILELFYAELVKPIYALI